MVGPDGGEQGGGIPKSARVAQGRFMIQEVKQELKNDTARPRGVIATEKSAQAEKYVKSHDWSENFAIQVLLGIGRLLFPKK